MGKETATGRRLIGLALVATLGMSACGGEDEESPESLSLDSESASESDSASESEASQPEAIQTSFPDIGLEITGLPKNPKAAKHELLSTWATFEHGHQAMTRSLRWNKMLTETAVGSARDMMRDQADGLKENDTHYTGDLVVELIELQRRGNFAVIDACYDTSRSRLVTNGKKENGPPGGTVRQVLRSSLNFAGGRWQVTGVDVRDEAC